MGGSGQRMGGSAQRMGRLAGPGTTLGSGYGRGTCLSRGNVGIVSEKLQTFRSKERARREFVAKSEGLGKESGGLGKECILWAKIEFLWAKKIASSRPGL